MENQSPLEKLTNQINTLKEKHVFFFVDTATRAKISKGYAGKYGSQNVWEFDDIIKKHQSVKGFLTHLKSQGVPGVTIMFYKKHGNRYLKADIEDVTCVLNTQSETPQNQISTINHQPMHTPPHQIPQSAPALGVPGQSIGLGFSQYMDFVKKESKLELVEKENRRLDEENLELKRKNNKLQLDLDEANSKCKLADDRLLLEKDKITSSSKGFFDNFMNSQMGAEAGKSLPQLLGFLTQIGKNQDAGLAGSAQASDPFEGLTASQAHLIKFMIQIQPSDEMAASLYNIIKGIHENPSVLTSINQLINLDNA